MKVSVLYFFLLIGNGANWAYRYLVLVLHCDSHFRARFIINLDHCPVIYMGNTGTGVWGNGVMESFVWKSISKSASFQPLDPGLLAGMRLFVIGVLVVPIVQLFILEFREVVGDLIRLHCYGLASRFSSIY